jgi:hypothetical protein
MSLSAAHSKNPFQATGSETVPQAIRDVVASAARAGKAASLSSPSSSPVSIVGGVAPASIPLLRPCALTSSNLGAHDGSLFFLLSVFFL